MAFRFNQYSPEKMTDGEWEEIADAEGDVGHFKIAKAGNRYHLEVSERLTKELDRKHPDGPPISIKLEYTAREWAEGVLRDWSDIYAIDEDGNEQQVPYSVENATQMLLNDTPLFNEVRRRANDQSRFLAQRAEVQAKKPQTSTGGKPSGNARAKASKTPEPVTDE